MGGQARQGAPSIHDAAGTAVNPVPSSRRPDLLIRSDGDRRCSRGFLGCRTKRRRDLKPREGGANKSMRAAYHTVVTVLQYCTEIPKCTAAPRGPTSWARCPIIGTAQRPPRVGHQRLQRPGRAGPRVACQGAPAYSRRKRGVSRAGRIASRFCPEAAARGVSERHGRVDCLSSLVRPRTVLTPNRRMIPRVGRPRHPQPSPRPAPTQPEGAGHRTSGAMIACLAQQVRDTAEEAVWGWRGSAH